ncbi:FeoB-associated Cys-rich membrane protein [Dyadobacter luticola]|uniref:FeoB-associated Cys-rich membrane protein n=1 Tax=Dyadobacter luticola TaxID=1979387 RepID=A0A5R9KXU5_9BACT|nr:FeoB-associated Cys-rich membrane protein [Dyadobacter luticola]TLV01132.1 FeoB-associated Cys-rich membrane protein [Dyadobacter luticola]
MGIQEIIILALFLVAAGYIGWRFWKTFSNRNSGGCAKGCGCAADKASISKFNA